MKTTKPAERTQREKELSALAGDLMMLEYSLHKIGLSLAVLNNQVANLALDAKRIKEQLPKE